MNDNEDLNASATGADNAAEQESNVRHRDNATESGENLNKPSETETETPKDPGPSTSAGAGQSTSQTQDGRFECNICLDAAKDAVISMCGHLFCWPCLHQWLETRPTRQTCPVCKSAISRDKVIPLYGRTGDNTDPRDKAPPRPQGQRSEPTTNYRRFNWGGLDPEGAGGGFQFSFGIGAFPFTMFGGTMSFGGERRPDAPSPGTREYEEEQFISKVFIWIAIIFILWLLVA